MDDGIICLGDAAAYVLRPVRMRASSRSRDGCPVTSGAGQGIGRAFAHALGEAGAAVAVVDINGVKALAVRDELRAKGVRAISIKADITKADACDKCGSFLLLHCERLLLLQMLRRGDFCQFGAPSSIWVASLVLGGFV